MHPAIVAAPREHRDCSLPSPNAPADPRVDPARSRPAGPRVRGNGGTAWPCLRLRPWRSLQEKSLCRPKKIVASRHGGFGRGFAVHPHAACAYLCPGCFWSCTAFPSLFKCCPCCLGIGQQMRPKHGLTNMEAASIFVNKAEGASVYSFRRSTTLHFPPSKYRLWSGLLKNIAVPDRTHRSRYRDDIFDCRETMKTVSQTGPAIGCDGIRKHGGLEGARVSLIWMRLFPLPKPVNPPRRH